MQPSKSAWSGILGLLTMAMGAALVLCGQRLRATARRLALPSTRGTDLGTGRWGWWLARKQLSHFHPSNFLFGDWSHFVMAGKFIIPRKNGLNVFREPEIRRANPFDYICTKDCRPCALSGFVSDQLCMALHASISVRHIEPPRSRLSSKPTRQCLSCEGAI